MRGEHMKNILKLLLIIFLLNGFLFAAGKNDKISEKEVKERIIKAVKSAIRVGKNYKLKDVKIKAVKKLEKPKNWKAYFLTIVLEVKTPSGKSEMIEAVDTVFSDGEYLAKDLLNLKHGRSIKKEVALDIDPKKYYNKEHLIAGNFNAKHKLVVFSDPECPFCQDFVPSLIKFVKKHPKDFALFYYHFPLDVIHPASPTLIKVIMAAEKKIKKDRGDFYIEVYEKYFDIPSTKEEDIIKAFNEAFKMKITKKEIHTPDIEKRFKEDVKMSTALAISGTPTLYLDGKKDSTRKKHLSLVKDNAKEKKDKK